MLKRLKYEVLTGIGGCLLLATAIILWGIVGVVGWTLKNIVMHSSHPLVVGVILFIAIAYMLGRKANDV